MYKFILRHTNTYKQNMKQKRNEEKKKTLYSRGLEKELRKSIFEEMNGHFRKTTNEWMKKKKKWN